MSSKLNEVLMLFANHITEEGIAAKQVMGLAEDAGISERTLNRAKRAIGIKSKRSESAHEWIWYMPKEAQAHLQAALQNLYNSDDDEKIVRFEFSNEYVQRCCIVPAKIEANELNPGDSGKQFEFSQLRRIFLIYKKHIFRGKIDYFAGIVPYELESNLMSGDAFVFCNTLRTQLSILQWHEDGFALFFKRSEYGRFLWPTGVGTEVVEIVSKDLKTLIEYPGLMLRLSGKLTSRNLMQDQYTIIM